MKKIKIPLEITEIKNIESLNETEQRLVAKSRQMTENAYAPYSGFYVGAALLLENGEIVVGSNQENAAYPSGLCAERVAAFAASSQFPGVKINTIAISARTNLHTVDHPVTPCGACRQVLLEYEYTQKEPIKLILSGEIGNIMIIDKVRDLLPLSFTAEELKKL